jgi:phospholipid/cholesterol/gamma-HCH transport system ATP-binding protein
VIRIEDLHKSFDENQVLQGISLEIQRGEVVALIGGSGHGKSVLLKHIAGLIRPDRGRILVDNQDIGKLRGGKLAALRERFGFLFQGGALFDSMTVFDNVAFPLREKTQWEDERVREKATKELEHVGLSGAEGKYPSQISGGMVKRAALARALVTEPEIMLFDEPTTGLDPVIGLSILKLIDSCHKRLSFTGVIVTHMIPTAFQIVDKVVMLHEGAVWAEGTPEDIMSSSDSKVRAYVGYNLDLSAPEGETDR